MLRKARPVAQRGDMLTTPDALPPVLTTAEARRRGVIALIRNGTYTRVSHGLHLVSGADETHPDVRIALATAGVAQRIVVGGWAAARLLERARAADRSESPCFDGWDRAGRQPAPVPLLSGPETRLVETPFRRLTRSIVPAEERVRVGKVSITSPLRTAFDLARLSGLEDAVIALDRLRALGLVDVPGLVELLDGRSRWLGVGGARTALALSADGVESPQESVLRLLWREAGLPVPLCNPTVVDESGDAVARVDLLDPDVGLVGEYDGAMHASAARRTADARRQERLEALGLTVIRATAEDVSTEPARAAWRQRVRRAHERARARRPASPAWTVR